MKALFDGTNLAFRCMHSKHVNMGDMIDYKMWRFTMFNAIYTFLRTKTNKAVDEVVVAFDAQNSWRYLTYPKYKAHRKVAKEKSEIDFDRFFKEMNDLIVDFKTHLPFKTMKIDRCEADDIIAVLTLHTKGTKVIVSRDEDFIQLLGKAKLYNPFTRKFVQEADHKRFLYEKICIGQAKDNIPNIKTPNDWPDDKRKPGFGKVQFDKLYDSYELEKWIEENDYTYNFKRNKKLIDFTEIPPIVKDTILSRYNNYKKPDGEMVIKLFQKHGWDSYLNNLTQVEPTIYKLLGD